VSTACNPGRPGNPQKARCTPLRLLRDCAMHAYDARDCNRVSRDVGSLRSTLLRYGLPGSSNLWKDLVVGNERGDQVERPVLPCTSYSSTHDFLSVPAPMSLLHHRCAAPEDVFRAVGVDDPFGTNVIEVSKDWRSRARPSGMEGCLLGSDLIEVSRDWGTRSRPFGREGRSLCRQRQPGDSTSPEWVQTKTFVRSGPCAAAATTPPSTVRSVRADAVWNDDVDRQGSQCRGSRSQGPCAVGSRGPNSTIKPMEASFLPKMNARCKFFRRGTCNRGDECRFIHPQRRFVGPQRQLPSQSP